MPRHTQPMSKQAHYHQFGREPLSLDVLKQHGDGTVDLGRGGELVVSRCRLATMPQPGCATLAPDLGVEMKVKGGKK